MTSDRRRQPQSRPGPAPDTPLEEVLLTIGRIVAPHGLRGEVKLSLVTDRPDQMADIRRVYLDGSNSPTRVTRINVLPNGHDALLKLQGINDRDSAEELRGATVQIRANQLPPPEDGAYFHFQILGLQAEDEAGNSLGEVTEIIEAGEVDVYVVTTPDGKQQLFPAREDVVLHIDPPARRMVVRLLVYVDDGAK